MTDKEREERLGQFLDCYGQTATRAHVDLYLEGLRSLTGILHTGPDPTVR